MKNTIRLITTPFVYAYRAAKWFKKINEKIQDMITVVFMALLAVMLYTAYNQYPHANIIDYIFIGAMALLGTAIITFVLMAAIAIIPEILSVLFYPFAKINAMCGGDSPDGDHFSEVDIAKMMAQEANASYCNIYFK